MDENETKYADFIKDRLQRNGGSLKFQNLTGQLSQLDHDVRAVVGAGQKELMSFLRKYDNIFAVTNGMVTLLDTPGKKNPDPPKDELKEKVNGKANSGLPKVINNVEGIVIKVHPTYGFLTIKEPLKTTVYFTPACFNDENRTLLTDLEIVCGKKVRLNAKLGNADFESKYRATKVWIPKNVQNEVLHPNGFQTKWPKTREEGLYDPNTKDGFGKIQKVFDSYGFIIIEDNPNNTVFFHKKRICNVENVKDLTKMLAMGDIVEFKAVRSQKQHVRWEATKVWIRKSLPSSNKETFEVVANKDSRSREIKNEVGKIYPHSGGGVVIKFGENDSKLADADSCFFYLHGTKVQDVSWEFCDGDNVTFDGIQIKSNPGYKALLAWVGNRPNIMLSTAIGDFSGISDDDVGEISENESCLSKASSTSAISGARSRLSENQRNGVYSSASSLVSNSSSKKSFTGSKSKINEEKQYYKSRDSYSSVSNNSQRPVYSKKGRSNRSKSRNSRFEGNSNSERNSYSRKTKLNNESKNSSKESLNSTSSGKTNYAKQNYKIENPNLYKNWGDSPYPDEDNESDSKVQDYQENDSKSPSDNVNSRCSSPFSEEMNEEINDDARDELSPNSDLQASDEKNQFAHNTSKNSSQITSRLSERYAEIFLSDDDCSETLEDVDEASGVKDDDSDDEMDESNIDTKSSTELRVQLEDKPKAYIKRFQNLEGKLKKVFCKYAEIENKVLCKAATFFFNDLYHNGAPVSEKFDDLKEVLKIGNSVKFNCFEIMDDSGCCFLKVTVAWIGEKKPTITETTSEEFISQNDLHVTADETLVNVVDENCAESMRHLNIKSNPAPPRKFLAASTSYLDDENEESESSLPPVQDNAGKSDNEESEKEQSRMLGDGRESDNGENEKKQSSMGADPQPLEQDDNSSVDLVAQEYSAVRERFFSELEAPMDIPQLTDIVSRLLQTCKNSEIDLNVVSSDIVNIVLSTVNSKRQDSTLSNASLHNGLQESAKAEASTNVVTPSNSQRPDMKDSFAQTIITGKIFSESIFTL